MRSARAWSTLRGASSPTSPTPRRRPSWSWATGACRSSASHLVTREAMALYVKHLKPDGVIVFQATNRYIDLLPVVKRLAAEFGFEAVNVADSPEADDGPEYWYSSTDQVIVTRNRKLLAWPRIDEVSDEIDERPDLPIFTDAHHN